MNVCRHICLKKKVVGMFALLNTFDVSNRSFSKDFVKHVLSTDLYDPN